MKGIQLIFKDWKAMWHHKHGRIALIFLLIVPLIYSGFFLAGYWDPYGRLDKLPVAIVNLDKGAAMDEKTIRAGDDFVKNLKENKELAFHFVSEKNADEGLKEDKYYMLLSFLHVTSQHHYLHHSTLVLSLETLKRHLLYKMEEGINTFGVKLNEATAGTKKIAD
ncbi:YhgE/Pip domain-containing protein, partial [Bacillus sp. B-TM1]